MHITKDTPIQKVNPSIADSLSSKNYAENKDEEIAGIKLSRDTISTRTDIYIPACQYKTYK